jgi:hypothetical protein
MPFQYLQCHPDNEHQLKTKEKQKADKPESSEEKQLYILFSALPGRDEKKRTPRNFPIQHE